MAQPKGLTFPVEVWRQIFDNVSNRRDKANLVHICRALADEARAVLYQTVFLKGHRKADQFYRALLCFPERATYVKHLHIFTVTLWGSPSIPIFIPQLFKMLKNVSHLTLGFCADREEQNYRLMSNLVMDCRWFPNLRTFITSLPLTSDVGLARFISTHMLLEELHATGFNHVLVGGKSFGRPVVFPSLRVLACLPHFLLQDISVAKNLTHLHLHEYISEHLSGAAQLFGQQLVSLRLSKLRIDFGDSWFVHDLVTAFPRLSFLHIDMEKDFLRPNHPSTYVRSLPVDWLQKPTVGHVDSTRTPKLTVAWGYPLERAADRQAVGRLWKAFLTDTASEVLAQRAHQVESIVSLHPDAFGVSFSLDAGGVLVCKNSEIGYKHWMYVGPSGGLGQY